MDEANAKAASKDGEADGVHRLRDILVEEVSLADRAANKRRFLVVKRSGDMADESNAGTDVEKAKKKPAAAASETEDEQKRKKPAAGDDEADDAEKARKPSSDDEDDDGETEKAKKPPEEEETDDAEKTPKRKQALAIPPPVKEAMLRMLTEALERLMALANRIKEATEPLPAARSRRAAGRRDRRGSAGRGRATEIARHAWGDRDGRAGGRARDSGPRVGDPPITGRRRGRCRRDRGARRRHGEADRAERTEANWGLEPLSHL